MNQKGFTYIAAMTIVVIIGILLGMTGQAWKTIKQREKEKELLFRGGQIKEAIENWYNPNYTVGGTPKRTRAHPLMNLEDLLTNPYALKPIRFLPHIYSTKLDDKNPKCDPDCPKIKLEEDPITSKKWDIITCGGVMGDLNKSIKTDQITQAGVSKAQTVVISDFCAGQPQSSIIGVASTSEDKPFKIDFKDTALEALSSILPTTQNSEVGGTVTPVVMDTAVTGDNKGGDGKISKYSDIKFIADKKNDHTKLYRSYRESW